ncbi:hypothetical protein ES703_42842 [subsurface metagenome]
MKHDWSFYDWFVLVFIIVTVAGILAAIFGPPVPYWQH